MALAFRNRATAKAIRLDDALAAVRAQIHPILDTEAAALAGARGRVLAADLIASRRARVG